jgi:hypothetical protein
MFTMEREVLIRFGPIFIPITGNFFPGWMVEPKIIRSSQSDPIQIIRDSLPMKK